MEPIPSREILWNVGSFENVVAMYLLMVLALLVGINGLLAHARLVGAGRSHPGVWARPWANLRSLFTWAVFQSGVVRERSPGIAHTLVYLGFLVLLFTTTMVFIDHDLGIKIYRGDFYLGVTVFSDLFGLGLLIGLGLFAHRRLFQQPDRLHNQVADYVLLGSLALMCLQGFALEGIRIKVTSDPWAWYSPVGLLFSRFFWGFSDDALRVLHYLVWWFHTITVFAAIAITPYTKFLHLIASSVNLMFRPGHVEKRALRSPGDIEAMIEKSDDLLLGTGTISDYTWKQLLDLVACTSCGRCQDACPAYRSGKPLSPKWLILDSRDHALGTSLKANRSETKSIWKRFNNWLVENLHFAAHQPASRGENVAVGAVVRDSGNPEARVLGGVLDENVFWSCTTCGACVETCPVGINHVEQIVENRRNSVLMEGELPSEAQATLRALETRGNPYGPAEDRTNWLTDLDVTVLEPGDSVDYLYWVGCVSSYDPRKQKIAQAFVRLLGAAGLSFGVLGSREQCSGDPARRLGEENLFQSLAKSNIETLRSISFKTLVATCPHCFHIIKNEYPQFGEIGERVRIIHHTQLLQELVAQGRLSLKKEARNLTFHDPCYLSRYNNETDAPRKVLGAVSSLPISEMSESGKQSLCCGAGGGNFWYDLKIGERVNSIRVRQAFETGAQQIGAACPFCMQMLEDGLKLENAEEQYQVKDVAEILWEQLKR